MAIEALTRQTYIIIPHENVRNARISKYHGKNGNIQMLLAQAGLENERARDETTLPVVIEDPVSSSTEDEKETLLLLSPDHGRSYEIGPFLNGTQPARAVRGRLYFAESFKGNKLSSPHIEPASNLPGNLLFEGLVDGVLAEGMVRTGLFFLEHGIEAELVEQVYMLDSFPLKDTEMSNYRFKQMLLDLVGDAIKRNREQQRPDPFDMKEVANYVEQVDFVVIRRLLPIGERIDDLIIPESSEEFYDIFGNIVDKINMLEQYDASQIGGYVATELSLDDPEVLRKYFHHLAEHCGKNLGRSHAYGVYLINGIASNWSAGGHIVDLESQIGEAVEDIQSVEELKKEGMSILDIEAADIKSLVFGKNAKGVLDVIDELYRKPFLSFSVPIEQLKQEFVQYMLKAYAKDRYIKLKTAPDERGYIGWAIPLLLSQQLSMLERFYLLDLCLFPLLTDDFDLTLEGPTFFAVKQDLFRSIDILQQYVKVKNIYYSKESLDKHLEGVTNNADIEKDVREVFRRMGFDQAAEHASPQVLYNMLVNIKLIEDPYNEMNPLIKLQGNERNIVKGYLLTEAAFAMHDNSELTPFELKLKQFIETMRDKLSKLYGLTGNINVTLLESEILRAFTDYIGHRIFQNPDDEVDNSENEGNEHDNK